MPIRDLAAMDTIPLTNGRTLNDVLDTHALWVEEESSGFRCVLERETLNEANLQAVSLQGALVKGSTFLDADMSGANLSRAVIDGADFQRAILTGADLSSAQISETEFSFCWLSGAILTDTKL